MLASLQVLRAELFELQQQQSHQHSSSKRRSRSHEKSSSRTKASVECPPVSSTAIPTSLPSILPSFLPSSLIPPLTFVDSIIVSVTPSTSQIHDPNPISNFVYSITCSIPTPTSILSVQLSQLFTCIDHITVMINKLVSNFLTSFFLKQTF